MENILSAIQKNGISSLESVVKSISSFIDGPDASIKDIKEIIFIDPPLAGQILALANSRNYHSDDKIGSIEKALNWIGHNAVKEVFTTQRTFESIQSDKLNENYRRSELWSYSVATALFAKIIFEKLFDKPGENVYSAGLLHKIGLIAEEEYTNKLFGQIISLATKTDLKLADAEKKILGFTHHDLGAKIALGWSLPDEIIYSIGYNDKPFDVPAKYFKICATIYVAGILCHFAEIGYNKATLFDDELYNSCLDELHLKQPELDLIMEDGRYHIAEMLEKGLFKDPVNQPD